MEAKRIKSQTEYAALSTVFTRLIIIAIKKIYKKACPVYEPSLKSFRSTKEYYSF